MLSFRALAFAVAAISAATAVPADAACGPGKTPTYADIQSVSYARTGCFGRCPAYEVLFTDYRFCEYVGELYVSKPGTYEDDCSHAILERVITALRLHDFYALNYDSRVLVMDAPHDVVSAMRCGVTTKLDWPAYQERQDIELLLDALDKITTRIPWEKKSDKTEPTWIR
jgi:hypothetical protein